MPAIVLVGAQWGDEGKGKIVDHVTERADMVVRYAGGPNAGHTLVVGDAKLVVRLLPSGILRSNTVCVLGQGMVIDPQVLVSELDDLGRRGVPIEGRVKVSDRAHLILPYHILVDGLREQGPSAIGTTKRGVGPCYEDKAARRGIQLGVFRDAAKLRFQIEGALAAWRPVVTDLGGSLPLLETILAELEPLRQRILPLLVDGALMANRAIAAGQRVLLEGAQGSLLDIDHGTYPFVTSSSATAGGACTGAGVGPTRIGRVLGLTKSYTTRVGAGPFPTELFCETGDRIRQVGGEFGSVTGRPRRTGWLDLVALRYAVRINGLDTLAMTKLDVLSGISELRMCVAYDGPEGRQVDVGLGADDPVSPVYETLPGWTEDLRGIRNFGDLPKNVRRFIEKVESEVSCPIGVVSIGSSREQTIVRQDVWGGLS